MSTVPVFDFWSGARLGGHNNKKHLSRSFSRQCCISCFAVCISPKMKTLIGFIALIAAVAASPMLQPPESSLWTGTAMDGVVKELRTECTETSDPFSCMKYNFLNFLDLIFSREALQVNPNGEEQERSVKTETELLDQVENYIKSHDVVAFLPGSYFEGTTLTLSTQNLDKNEVSLNLKFPGEREGKSAEEGRKTKLKKIIIPVLVFVLLKAMTLIPLAIGVLGIKAWNALQLSFFSFVISVALAIFQLCKKIASDHTAQVAAHGPWDNYQAAHYVARSFPEDLEPLQPEAQDLAYRAYAPS